MAAKRKPKGPPARYNVWVENAEIWGVLVGDLTREQAAAVEADIRKGSSRYPNVKRTAAMRVMPWGEKVDMYTGLPAEQNESRDTRPPALSMPGAHFADSPAQRQDFAAFTARERAAERTDYDTGRDEAYRQHYDRPDSPGSPSSMRASLEADTRRRTGTEERAIARRLFTYPLHGDPANVVPVASVEDAQDKWIEYRDRAGSSTPGVRSAEIGSGVVVVDELGREVARISYNGRIWPAGEPGPGESRAPKPLQALWPDQIRRAVEAMPGNPKPKANLLRLALKNDRKALLYIDQFLAKHGGLEGAERAEIRRMNQNPEGRALLAKKLTFEDGVVDIRSKGVGQNARIGGTWRHPVRNGAVIVLDQLGDTWTAMDGAARRYHGKTAADAVDKALAVMNAEIFGGT